MNELSQGKPIDRYIPWFFVLFFLVFMILDGIFVYIAVYTHTGVVTEKAYEKGLDYDAFLEKAEKQKASGVLLTTTYENDLFRLVLRDADGQPMDGAAVKALFFRPVSDGHDFSVSLTSSGDGVYSTEGRPPMPGAWTVKVEAEWKTQIFRTTARISAQ